MLKRKADLVALYNTLSASFSEPLLYDLLKPTGRGNSIASRDYYRALRYMAAIFDLRLSPEQVRSFASLDQVLPFFHPSLRYRLSFDTPELAAQYDTLSPKDQEALFDNRDWVASTKIDGFRVWVCLFNDPSSGFAPGAYLYSRNHSQVDGSLCEYWDHVYQTVRIPEGTLLVLDCECTYNGPISALADYGLIAETPLQGITSIMQLNAPQSLAIQDRYFKEYGTPFVTFSLIHPLIFNGVDFTKLPLGEGVAAYDQALKFAQECGLNIIPINRCDGSREEKMAFLDSILASGGEGVVFWNKKGSYSATENRSKAEWVKLKRSVSASLSKDGMGDSIDAYVTGFKLHKEDTTKAGLIAALECSIQLMEPDGSTHEHVISYVPGLELELAKRITIRGISGEPTLHPDIYGKVVELDGQDISAKSLRLSHPRLIRWRTDKDQDECVYTRQWLESQIL